MAKTGLTPTDELVRRAMIGDATAFTRLWDTNITALRVYLKNSFKQLDGFYIDDICSRSFEKAFRQISRYDPSVSLFSTWLRTIADGSDTPLEQIVKNEDSEKLEKYIDGLPELYREIARMRLIDGLQYKEIAEELDIELNTVRTRIRRAKSMLDEMKASEDEQ